MSSFEFTSVAPDGWATCRDDYAAVFGTVEWQDLLESSFGCRTLYASNGNSGVAISVFEAGPFSVGYIGFPAGSVFGDPSCLEQVMTDLRSSKPLAGLSCVRLPVSGFGTDVSFDASFATNPETAIPDLRQWDLMRVSKNLRRDIRKAERSGLTVERVADRELGAALFDMYESAVRHHGGSLRYNDTYFSALLELAGAVDTVRVYVARHETDIAGFAAIVHHAGTAYYLHGGSSTALRQLSPSDLILASAIDEAKSADCREFNFMASPPDQPTLVRYKEKWGGETRGLRTYTIPVSGTYPLFRLAESLYRLIS